MPMLTYDTFDLIVEKLPDGSYRARVVDPPSGGRPYVDFAWPSAGAPRWRPQTGLAHGTRHFKAVDPDQQPPPGAEALGRQLYATIFAGDIGASLLSSLTLSAQQGKGLRIRLHVEEAPELANLPWEALYLPERSRFLVLSHETPLVRYIDVRAPAPSLPVELPLRILAVIASPAGYPELNVEEEWRRLEGALADLRVATR